MPQAQLNISNVSDILSKLNIGDVVRAKVIDIQANDLILKLFDGTMVTASSLSELGVKSGEFVDFNVKGKLENKLILETVKNPKSNELDSEIKKQLLSLNIKPDNTAMDVAKELKNQSIPINRDIIQKAVEGLLTLKNLTPDKAVFLAANNLEINEQHISKLNGLIENKAKLGSDIKDLVKLLESVDNSKLLQNIEKKLSDAVEKNMSGFKEAISQTKDVEIPPNRGTDVNSVVVKLINKELEQASNNLKQLDMNKLQQSIEKAVKQEISPVKDFNADKFVVTLGKELKSYGINLERLPEPLQKELFSLAKSILENAKVLIEAYSSDKESITIQTDKVKSFIAKELESIFVKIDENTTGKDIEAKKVLNDLLSRLDAVKDELQQSSIPAAKEMLAKIDSMESNIRFLNDINNFSSYIQIPLNVNNSNTTGELYILKRNSKKKKIDPENATMYISLNTENMGQVDSLISVNKKNITVNMRVAEQRIIDFLKENQIELYNRLQEKGYKLVDFKYRLLDMQANAVNINSVIQKEMEGSRRSIDYKI